MILIIITPDHTRREFRPFSIRMSQILERGRILFIFSQAFFTKFYMLLQSLTLLSIVTDLEISRCFKELISHLHILIRITKFDWISRYSEYNHWIQNYLNYSGLNLSILLISLDKEAKIFCLPQCLLNFLTKLFMMSITRNTKDLPIENTLFHHMNLNWAKVFNSSFSFILLPFL